jgi:hypothetical protein
MAEEAPLAQLRGLLQDYLLHAALWMAKFAHRARCVRERLLHLLRESVLNENEWEVVEVVFNQGPLTANEIAKAIGRRTGDSFHRLLSVMVKRGVLRKEPGGYLFDHSWDYFNSL